MYVYTARPGLELLTQLAIHVFQLSDDCNLGTIVV